MTSLFGTRMGGGRVSGLRPLRCRRLKPEPPLPPLRGQGTLPLRELTSDRTPRAKRWGALPPHKVHGWCCT